MAIGITQLEEKPGLAAGLIFVGLLCFRVSDLAIEGAEGHLGSRENLTGHRAVRAEALEAARKAQQDLQGLIAKGWPNVQSGLKSMRSYKGRLICLIAAILALQALAQSIMFPIAVGQRFAPGGIGGCLRSVTFFFSYDVITTGPLLVAAAWTGSILIARAQAKWFAQLFKLIQACIFLIWIAFLFLIYDGSVRYFVLIGASVSVLLMFLAVFWGVHFGRGPGRAVPQLAAAFLFREAARAETALEDGRDELGPRHL
ncbi:hypothetical protein [Sinomonas sp. RB5]